MEASNSPSPPSSCLCHSMNDLWGYNLGIRVQKKHRCSQTIHQCSFPEFSTACSQQRRAPQSARLCVLVAAVKRKRPWLVVWFCSCADCVDVFLHRFDRARLRRVFSWSLQSARLPTAQGLPTTSGHFSHMETLLWFGATSQDSCSLCNDWVVAATLSSCSVTSVRVLLGHHRRKQMLEIQVHILLLGPWSDLCHFRLESVTITTDHIPQLTFQTWKKCHWVHAAP